MNKLLFNDTVLIRRRVITDIYGNTFPVYGFEEFDKINNRWVERINYTSKEDYDSHFYLSYINYKKVGDWETRPDL